MTGFRWAVPRHTQRSPPRRDPDSSSPVPGGYRNARHSFRQQLLRKTQVLPRFTVASGRPDVVAAFVDKHTVAHYGMVHKPGGV